MLSKIVFLISFITLGFSNLFISEAAEGSSNNKYLEFYNAGSTTIDLSDYAFPNVSNAPDVPGEYEYWNAFTDGAEVDAGDVYVVCHPDSDPAILAECDQEFTYLSNGDDGFCLVEGVEGDYTILDCVGDWNGDPGSGWDVCGNGSTKDHTIFRKSSVTEGNDGDWAASAGTDADDCEWIVLEQNDWTMLGFHEMDAMSNEYIVEAGNHYYSPSSLTINVGETVIWDNVDGFHDVVAYDGSFDTDACSAPCTIGEITFNTPGTYDYYCSVGSHEQLGMVGTIIVEDIIVLNCEDETACNFNEPGECVYIAEGECDCDGNVEDCLGECGGDAVVDSCGVCDGDDACSTSVDFLLDMSLNNDFGTDDQASMRLITQDGQDLPGDWVVMSDDDNDLLFKANFQLTPGSVYEYNFSDGWYEDGGTSNGGDSTIGECASGQYGNNRTIVVTETDMIVGPFCWESCEACPEDIEGCTDEDALNYDENATIDDGSCFYEWPAVDNLFFSEYAEGTSNNKYLEIYNATDSDVDLNGYSISSCSNGCDEVGEWDYPDNVTFDATVASGDVYVVCNGSADPSILADCDQTFTYLSNGNDVMALTQVGSGLVLDVIGLVASQDDTPGNGSGGWSVAGVENGTLNHTLVRKSSVTSGNPLWLDNPDTGEQGSAGDDAEDSEWIVLDVDTWDYLGFHEMDSEGEGCTLNGDVNTDGILNVLDVVQIVSAIVDSSTDSLECADMNGDGIINVLDIVQIVGTITGGRSYNADSATLDISDNMLTLKSNGYIGGVQLTLEHNQNFELNLTDDCMVSDYKNYGTYSIVLIVEPKSEILFTTNSKFEISDVLVANSDDEIKVLMMNDFSLSNAYPNPFNPSTSFSIDIPDAGYLTVKVYSVSGQLVEVLSSGFVNANKYDFTWEANNMAAGVYVINAEFEGKSISHNVSLIK